MFNIKYKDTLWKVKNDEWFCSFDEEEWKDVIEFFDKTWYHTIISKNTIELSKKIYKDTGILVYPVISRTYCSRNMKKNGAFAWTMYEKNGREVGCIDTVASCLKKSMKFVVDTSWKDVELVLERVDKNDKS